MLDSGVRLAAASLPVGVPVIVGLVVAVLRRRELPAVSTPAIVGLAVQLVVVLISTFLVAATSFDAFSLSPETLLPLSSVLGFVVILLQVVCWTLLLIALFRRLPGATPAPSEDRTPTGRHALVDDRGDQVIAEAGTTFLPVGAGATSRTGPPTGPRPVTGPPTPPPYGAPPVAPPGPPSVAPSVAPPGPPPGVPYRTTTVTRPGPLPGNGPASPGSPLPSMPIPVGAPTPDEPEDEVQDADAPEIGDTESADTETIQAYREPEPGPTAEEPEAPEEEPEEPAATDDAAPEEDTGAGVTQEDAEDAAGAVDAPDDGRYPGHLQEAEDGAAEPEATTGTTEFPGYLEGVESTESTETADGTASGDDAPGEDVDEEPPADADAEGDHTGATDGSTDGSTDGGAGGHPWFDPDGEAARTAAQPERS
ncbi:hypothetical protein [Actinomycetospora flava]|uniref:Uncharacterized protein n=1 Tax=Actinomycetospora flava TaxID=3129232 RepID=A0ABU8LZ10_9PSEU